MAKNQTNCNNQSMQRKITQRADDNTSRVFQKRGKTRGNKVFMLVLLSQNVCRVSFISTFFCIFRIFLSKITLTSAIPNHKILHFSLNRLWISQFFFKVRLVSRDLTNIVSCLYLILFPVLFKSWYDSAIVVAFLWNFIRP